MAEEQGLVDALRFTAMQSVQGMEVERLTDYIHEGGTLLRTVTPDEYTENILDLEEYAPIPRRKRGDFSFTRASSFSAYVTKHTRAITDPIALILATEGGRFVAYLNAHTELFAGWHDHRATFQPQATPQWQAWVAASGKWFTQAEFAEFLDDRIGDIAEPDGATLYNVTTTLRVKSDINFQSGIKLHNGQVNLTYQEEISAGGGAQGEIPVPERLTLLLQPFEDGAKYELAARFRFRASGGKASFHYELGEEIQRVTREEVARLGTEIETATGLSVLYGSRSGF